MRSRARVKYLSPYAGASLQLVPFQLTRVMLKLGKYATYDYHCWLMLDKIASCSLKPFIARSML